MSHSEKEKISPTWVFQYYSAINLLNDKKYFDRVINAVEGGKEELFTAICEEAGVPTDFIEPIKQKAFEVPFDIARWFPAKFQLFEPEGPLDQ